MSETTKPSTLFWVISGIGLLWYLFGAYQFYGSLVATQESLKSLVDSGSATQGYVDFLLAMPTWVTGAFGLATISGVIGCICLLMRKKIARVFFILSIIGAVAMYLYMFVLSGNSSVLPASDYIIAAMVTLITAFMIWFSGKKIQKGYLA